MSKARWMQERLELMREMKASCYAPDASECDFIPPLELIGIYICHCTISRMVAEGKLDTAAGTYLNGALGANAFCVLHHCTHESISQHNPEHEQFENTVFRLACQLLFFDDGYKVAHRAHHQRCNEPDDPDLILSHTSLPELGSLLRTVFTSPEVAMVSIGAPVSLREVRLMHTLGLTSLIGSPWLLNLTGKVNWDNQLLKVICRESFRVLKKQEDYRRLSSSLQATWRTSAGFASFILALFFARYPHRNGTTCVNEVASFYDSTFRGEGQVDLWMMGEGPHHMHHAKSDVSYSRLPKVCEEVEQRCPHLKLSARTNVHVLELEHTKAMPAKLQESSPGSLQSSWERAQVMKEAKDLLATNVQDALAQIAGAVFQSAFHTCTTADRSLLCHLHKHMKFRISNGDGANPVAWPTWNKTLLSDETTQILISEKDRIAAEIASVSRQMGARLPIIGSEEGLKEHYIDFFVALLDTMIGTSQQRIFMQHLAATFGRDSVDMDRNALIMRLRRFLESPLPDDFIRRKKANTTTEKHTFERASHLLFGLHSKL